MVTLKVSLSDDGMFHFESGEDKSLKILQKQVIDDGIADIRFLLTENGEQLLEIVKKVKVGYCMFICAHKFPPIRQPCFIYYSF